MVSVKFWVFSSFSLDIPPSTRKALRRPFEAQVQVVLKAGK